jgi:polysaccharide export outer membrane protein
MRPIAKSLRGSAGVFSAALFLFLAPMSWSQETPSTPNDNPPPAGEAAPADSSASGAAAYTDGSYRLRVNDLLRITVFQEDDLTTETRISESGSINFPLIGSVRVAGRTVNDVTEEIRARLDKDYLVNPHVTLLLVEFSKQMVTVLGEVQKPGQVQIPAEGGLDLLGAIALAGGYTRVANPAHVTVRRMVNGEDKIFLVDAKKLARDSTVGQFLVLPGDTINVGQSIF